jgi:translation initiation factor 2 gamma subunit (eIF-2gamma)
MGSIPTMLKGIIMSDAVLILSRPNPKEPASFSDPPTLEVLAAADLMGKTILVVQSRTDTASQSLLENHRAQIQLSTHVRTSRSLCVCGQLTCMQFHSRTYI